MIFKENRRLSFLSGLFVFILACSLLEARPLFALMPDEVLSDPALERRARDISTGIRCLVCQNQAIDDSDADLARDLRLLIRERLVAGDSDAEARQYLVDRYGDYVLLKPPFKAHSLLLWAAPLIAILFGGGLIWWAQKSRRRKKAAPALTREERAELDQLLNHPTSDKIGQE